MARKWVDVGCGVVLSAYLLLVAAAVAAAAGDGDGDDDDIGGF